MDYKIKIIDRYKIALRNRKKLPSKLQTALHGHYIPNDLCGKSNAKTLKGEKKNVTTYVMYLAPHTQNSQGINICTNASEGCIDACLFSAGRGRFGSVIYARTNKTEYYLKEKKLFLYQLEKEIQKYINRHKKDGSKFAIRLNGKILIDGDQDDLRYMDSKGIVVLYAKGDGKKDESGFVINNLEQVKKYVKIVTQSKVIA